MPQPELTASSRIVSLVGLPGSGKSTIGRLLAKALDVPFEDVDSNFERRFGMSIGDYFLVHGEAAFRTVEAALVEEAIAKGGPAVVATGGGVVLHAANRDRLRSTFVVYLHATPDELWPRLRRGSGRPLLANGGRDQLEALFVQRRPLYEEIANLRIETGRSSAAEVAGSMAVNLRERWTA